MHSVWVHGTKFHPIEREEEQVAKCLSNFRLITVEFAYFQHCDPNAE
jgi:hypothetical protein